MSDYPHQGDILKIEHITPYVLVVSKNFFNESGEVIVCPILPESSDSPLHIAVSTHLEDGKAQCEKVRLIDCRARRWQKKGSIPLAGIADITDAIQGIFDYV